MHVETTYRIEIVTLSGRDIVFGRMGLLVCLFVCKQYYWKMVSGTAVVLSE